MFTRNNKINFTFAFIFLMCCSLEGWAGYIEDAECKSGLKICELGDGDALHLDTRKTNNELLNVTVKIADVLQADTYKLVLVLEEMMCDTSKHASLKITTSSSPARHYEWCTRVNYKSYDFIETKFIAQDTEGFVIKASSDYENFLAALTITLVKETTENCNRDEIYCGRTGDEKKRCISEKFVCDKHANCGGMSENADQLCCTQSFYGYSCWHLNYFWIALFSLVVVVLIPTLVITLLCFSRNRIRRRGQRVQQRRLETLANDHPPTYSDVHTEVPPPCFCTAVKFAGNDSNVQNGEVKCDCKK